MKIPDARCGLATNLTWTASTSRMNLGAAPSPRQIASESQMKTRLLSITVLFLFPLGAAAQTAEEIVKKALEARGGGGKIKAGRSHRVSGHVAFSQRMAGTLVF